MFRKAHALLASLALCGLLVASAAEGQGIGSIEVPPAGQTVSGIVTVGGFAIDFKKIDKVELFVDGILTNRADLSLPRPDVFGAFPQFVVSPDKNPGFVMSFLASSYANGPHAISVLVTESDQSTFTLGPITVIVDNSITQPPFGFIDVPGPDGFAGASGSIQVIGWVLDDVSVDHIDFLIDNRNVATAIGMGLPGSTALYGAPRPEVRAAYPDVPNSLFSGFLANIDVTRLTNGFHVLDVRATDNTGANASIGSRPLQVVNNIGLLGPFGWLDFPLDKASLICSPGVQGGGPSPSPVLPPSLAPGILNFATGWALSTGTRPGKGSVVWVELLLDGAVIANTQRDCYIANGKMINCYGGNRPDVAQVYPGYLNGDNGGFAFAFEFFQDDPLGLLTVALPTPVPAVIEAVTFTRPGKHTLSVRAGSDEGAATEFASISVDLLCDATIGNQPAFGYIDRPRPNEGITGVYGFSGWAYDLQGVLRIEVDIDGQVVARSDNGTATYGGARPDVPLNDVRVPAPGNVGWGALIDTTKFGDGPHEVIVYVWDNPNSPNISRRTEIGRREFIVNNNVPTHQ